MVEYLTVQDPSICPDCGCGRVYTDSLILEPCRACSAATGTEQPSVEIELVGDRYEILSTLGKGGMGVVYKAFDHKLSRPVALKFLEGAGKVTASDQRRMLREAQALAQLSHPNVVSAYDVGTFATNVFMAMEIAQGIPLDEWLLTPHSSDEIMSVMVGAGRGLAGAHASGIIHCDFKPRNVVVSSDGVARVVDFGLARLMTETPEECDTFSKDEDLTPVSHRSVSALQQPLTHASSIVGTLGYSAPEQINGGVLHATADQFSFAATVFHALNGHSPFSSKNAQDYRESLENYRAQDLQWSATVPRRVRSVIEKGLEFAPENRHPSVARMVDLLERQNHRVGITGALGAAVLLGVGVYAMGQPVSTPNCQLDSAPFSEMWNADRQEAVRTGFAATEARNPQMAFGLFRDRLGEYIVDWQSAKLAACRDTFVQGKQTEALYNLRSVCLDRKRDQIASLLDLLVTADAAMVTRAPGILLNFAPLGDCADTHELLGEGERLPEDATIRARIAKVEADNDTVEVLWTAGKYDTALELSTSALQRAKDIGYLPSIVRLHLTLSKSHRYAGKTQAVADHLLEAIPVAVKASLNRELGWLSLRLLEHWLNTQKYAEARGLFPLVEANILRSPTAELMGGMLFFQGRLLSQEGKLSEAEVILRRSVEMHSGINRRSRVGSSLVALSANYDRQHKYKQSMNALKEAEAITREFYGDNHPRLLTSFINHTEIAAKAGLMQEAQKYIRRAKQLYSELGEPKWASHYLWYLEGKITEKLQGCERALPMYTRAHETRAQMYGTDSRMVAAVGTDIGRCMLESGNVLEAFSTLTKTVNIYSQIGDDTPRRAEAVFVLAQARIRNGGSPKQARIEANLARGLWSTSPYFSDKIEEVDRWLESISNAPRQ